MVRLGLGADEKWGGESVTPVHVDINVPSTALTSDLSATSDDV